MKFNGKSTLPVQVLQMEISLPTVHVDFNLSNGGGSRLTREPHDIPYLISHIEQRPAFGDYCVCATQ